jgi:hypothetical protein
VQGRGHKDLSTPHTHGRFVSHTHRSFVSHTHTHTGALCHSHTHARTGALCHSHTTHGRFASLTHTHTRDLKHKTRPHSTTCSLIISKEWDMHQTNEKRFAYFLELHEVLCIQLIIYLGLECCLHLIQLVPLNSLKPRMSLRKGSKKWLREPYKKYKMREAISSAPALPILWSTSHNKRQMRSLASSDNFGLSGNFR